MRSRRAVVHAALTRSIGVLAGSTVVSYDGYKVCATVIGATSAQATATRVLCSLCCFAFATAVWTNAEPRVLHMLVRRPRVLYFVGAVLLSELLSLLTGRKFLISAALLSIGASACFLVVPFSDSVPPSVVGPALLRAVCPCSVRM